MRKLKSKKDSVGYLDLGLFIETGRALCYYYKGAKYLIDFYNSMIGNEDIAYANFGHRYRSRQEKLERVIFEIHNASDNCVPVQAISKLFYYADKAGILTALSRIKECMHHDCIVDDLNDWEAGFQRDIEYLREHGSYMVSSPKFTYESCLDDIKDRFAIWSDILPSNPIGDHIEIVDIDHWYKKNVAASESEDMYSEANAEYDRVKAISCHSEGSNIWLLVNFLVAVYFEKNMDLERDFAKQLAAYRQSKYYTPCY